MIEEVELELDSVSVSALALEVEAVEVVELVAVVCVADTACVELVLLLEAVLLAWVLEADVEASATVLALVEAVDGRVADAVEELASVASRVALLCTLEICIENGPFAMFTQQESAQTLLSLDSRYSVGCTLKNLSGKVKEMNK